MHRSGRASWVLVAGLASIALVAAIFFLGGEGPSAVANKFMKALARGDVNQLAALSTIGENSTEELKKKWEYAVNVAGPHYRFAYAIRSERQMSDDEAAVSIGVWRNYFSGIAYDEKFELPMIRKDGKWLVEVRGINREMYPGLPR